MVLTLMMILAVMKTLPLIRMILMKMLMIFATTMIMMLMIRHLPPVLLVGCNDDLDDLATDVDLDDHHVIDQGPST